MKRLSLFLGVMLGLLPLTAQPAFSGGAGGGYARATLSRGANALDDDSQPSFVLFPNPLRVGEMLQVKLEDKPIQSIDIQIINPIGQVSHEATFSAAASPLQLLLPRLPAGHYVLRIRHENAFFSQPLILLPE